MSANMHRYEGLTFFSAIDQAGLLLHPVIGMGAAFTRGRELHYDPTAPPGVQRQECIGQIARRLAAQGEGSEAECASALGAAVLPV